MSWRVWSLFGLLLLGCDTAKNALCPGGTVRQGDECVEPPPDPNAPAAVRDLQKIVRVSSVGYVPGRAKQATYAGPSSTFVVRSADDDSVVFPDEPGPVGRALNAEDSGESEVHVVDFSDLNAPGEYYVEVKDVGYSDRFRIGEDVFVDAFQASMLGMYGWRCGSAVSFEWQGVTFGHHACHLNDGPGSGGWHDAGDYGKYTNNGAFALGMMLAAWDHFRPKLENVVLPIPEQDNAIPDYLDECIYQANWLVGMQLESGGASDRITAANFDGLAVMPEASNAPRNMAPASTKATGDLVGALAHMARIVREFDADLADTYEEAAKRGWQFLIDNATPIPPPLNGYTGSYGLGANPDPDTDDRAWAAAELWETTGDAEVLTAFEEFGKKLLVQAYWDWDNVSNLGVFSYLASEREGKDPEVVQRLTSSLRSTTDAMVKQSQGHAYGRSLGASYNWGINGTIARTTLAIVLDSRLAPDHEREDLDAASLQLYHLFGRNYYGRSFLTGVGVLPPLNPHYRPAVGDGIDEPWPGLLVGGSWAQQSSMSTPGSNNFPADQWKDDSNNYQTNEVAINWNAALIYNLAAFLPE